VKPVNPFLAFSVQKEVTNDAYQEDIDPNIQVVLKKMSKKDSTTKLKVFNSYLRAFSASFCVYSSSVFILMYCAGSSRIHRPLF